MPVARRPKTRKPGPRPGSCGSSRTRSGVQRFCRTGNANPSGMTPTTVACVAPSRTTRPITAGSAPNRIFQRRFPRTTTAGDCGDSSSSTSTRPIRGGTPVTRKAAALISAASTGSPTCSPTIRFRWTNRNAPMSSRVRSPSRQVRTSYAARRSSAGLCPVPVVQPDDAISVRERQRRIGHPRDDLECAGTDGDRDSHRQAPDDREHRIPGQHPESQLEVQPRQSHAHQASPASVAPSLHDEMQSERDRLPPIASSRARQTVPPTIALENFVEIARDGLTHVGRQRVFQQPARHRRRH